MKKIYSFLLKFPILGFLLKTCRELARNKHTDRIIAKSNSYLSFELRREEQQHAYSKLAVQFQELQNQLNELVQQVHHLESKMSHLSHRVNLPTTELSEITKKIHKIENVMPAFLNVLSSSASSFRTLKRELDEIKKQDQDESVRCLQTLAE